MKTPLSATASPTSNPPSSAGLLASPRPHGQCEDLHAVPERHRDAPITHSHRPQSGRENNTTIAQTNDHMVVSSAENGCANVVGVEHDTLLQCTLSKQMQFPWSASALSNMRLDLPHPRSARKGFVSAPSTPLKAPTLKQSHPNEHSSTSTMTTTPTAFPFPLVAPPEPSTPRSGQREPSRPKHPSSNGLGKTPSADTFSFPETGADVDPQYPTPNLYDIILTLNAHPGLDAWWSNLVQVLRTHYGAERASLAVPGDATDLENVPWGQKATFSRYGYDFLPAHVQSGHTPTTDKKKKPAHRHSDGSDHLTKFDSNDNPNDTSAGGPTGSGSAKRPKLMARHSFAGYGKYLNEPSSSRDAAGARQGGLQRRRSANDKQRKVRGARPKSNDELDETTSAAPQHSLVAESRLSENAALQTPTAVVFPVPRALEVEPDPLIKRTGVVRLFGRTKPTILTREYIVDTPQASSTTALVQQQQQQQQHLPSSSSPTGHHTSNKRTHQFDPPYQPMDTSIPTETTSLGEEHRELSPPAERYEDYEQTPLSPWSQSPAPSPAPLPNPEQNPFFTTPEVNEDAFASSPPPFDYSDSKNVQAIGIDNAKTVVHVPLLHSRVSGRRSSDTLRFPVAVVSFLSPIVPYPSNWSTSLSLLLPHLTSSYCLAYQYSQLEKRLSSTSTSRYGHILGLGGTFSDASSELELVAGLTGHVNYSLAEEPGLSSHYSGVASTPVPPGVTRSSSVLSMGGVVNSDVSNAGPRNEFFFSPGPTSKHGSESSDSYFKLKQASSSSNGKVRSPKAPADEPPSALTSPRLQEAEKPADDALTSRDPGLGPTFSGSDGTHRSAQGPAAGQQPVPTRHSSSTSIATQLQREFSSRPFPDTIAQLMLNSVPLHLFLAKPQTGEVIWTNSKFDAYRQSQPQERRVRDPWQNVHESEREHLEAEWAKALKTGSQITERVRVKRFNDENAYRWFIFRANPLLSQTGELLYWIGSFLDVHEQHMAEMKAAEERERFARDAKYRALANSIPQVVFEAAEYRGLISANEQWELYTGQPLEDAQNFGFAKYVHRDDLERCGIVSPPMVIPDDVEVPEFSHIVTNSTTIPGVEGSKEDSGKNKKDGVSKGSSGPFRHGVTLALQELVKRGVVTKQQDENGRYSYTTEVRFRSRKGEFRWHLVRLVKVENPFGNGEASWYGTCTDINDRKILERELNSAMQKLNNEMESKTKFFSNMSHEIRTPLNGILGTIPFILETPLDNDQRRMLDTIQNSSTNLRELVDNILDVSRVEAGKMNIVPQWFHVRSMLEDVMDTIASRAIDKGLELNYLVDTDVPSMVMGDRFRIRQILINLVGNAVKFTSQGEIYTRCSLHYDNTVTLKPSEILLNFEVVDTGKGFSSADAERLMQRFSQIESNGSQQHAGSGLGLFLSKQLVEMHGGRLTPTSKEGRGAKFSFFVKVTVQSPSSPPPAAGKRKLNAAGLPALEPSPDSLSPPQAIVKHELVESPSQESFSTSSLNIPDQSTSTHSEASFASISSVVSPTFSSAASSSDAKPQHAQQTSEQGELPAEEETEQQLALVKAGDTAVVEQKPPREPYSVLIVCPFDYAREAIQQHIEQVIPLEVEAKVTSVLDVEDFKELVISGECATLTHVVLCLPDTNDVFEVMHHVLPDSHLGPAHCSPTLVVVADPYLKREITSRYESVVKERKKVFIVLKPVKPSAFAEIFDPYNERDLSKDRNQDMARELNNSFKTMSKLVKEVIGNKGYRVLLVEDDETNRSVMLKYLEKVKLASDTASNGQECIDMVFSKEPGYYSLIICDIQMPVKNGYETCQEIRSWEQRNHFPEIPIMALSANAMMDQIDDAARAGFNDYVTKPIKHNELGRMMMDLLDPSSPRVLLKDRRLKSSTSSQSSTSPTSS
ncbi:hypothetical protein VTO42DRAFT_5887 [Malbranchea cinnamomea]